MAAQRLNDLAERKRLLVLEADLHRGLIEMECASLRTRLDSAHADIRAGSPWLMAGATAAGLLISRRWRGLARWIPTALTAWRWLQRLK